MTPEAIVRPMTSADLAAATRAWRRAFAKQFAIPDPEGYRRDVQTVETRFATAPELCFVAERQGQILGSVLGMSWGTLAVLGPLTVDPEFWGQGLARHLTRRFVAAAEAQAARLVALYTFPQSTTHLRLYEGFGFVPMTLTPVLGKAVPASATAPPRLFRQVPPAARAVVMQQCRAIAEAQFAGLDLSREIAAVNRLGLGDTVLIEREGAVAGFAICHWGGGEATGDELFVKFAAVPVGEGVLFERLLDAIEALAAARGLKHITAGVNVARRDAYRRLVACGYRASLIGVAMHRPDAIGTLRGECYVVDDFR